MQQLAIASVPPQTWSTPQDPVKALKMGTIFQELNLPFYLSDESSHPLPKNEEDTVNYAKRFAIYDCMLYLDTHPSDPEALSYYEQMSGHPYSSWMDDTLPWGGGDAICGAMKDNCNSL